MAVAGLLSGCDQADDPASSSAAAARPTPAPDAAAPSAGEGPRIEFTTLEHDFGTVIDTQTYETSFQFTNAGTETLVVRDITAACGCTTPTLARWQYEAGESGEITVIFDPEGKEGRQDRRISVLTSASSEPVHLMIHADIVPLVSIDPKFARFNVVEMGRRVARTIDLHHADPNLEIVDVATNNPHVTARLVQHAEPVGGAASAAAYRSRLEVAVEPTAPWGTIYATRATFAARGRHGAESSRETFEREYTLYVLGTVFGDVHSTVPLTGAQRHPGALVSFGMLTPDQPFEAVAELTRRSGQPLEILDARVVESTMPGVQVRVEPAGPSSARVVIHGDTGAHRGRVQGVVQVTTNVPGEEQLPVRFAGNVSG